MHIYTEKYFFSISIIITTIMMIIITIIIIYLIIYNCYYYNVASGGRNIGNAAISNQNLRSHDLPCWTAEVLYTAMQKRRKKKRQVNQLQKVKRINSNGLVCYHKSSRMVVAVPTFHKANSLVVPQEKKGSINRKGHTSMQAKSSLASFHFASGPQ